MQLPLVDAFKALAPGKLNPDPLHTWAEPGIQWMDVALPTFHKLHRCLGMDTGDIFFQECLLELDETWSGLSWPVVATIIMDCSIL